MTGSTQTAAARIIRPVLYGTAIGAAVTGALLLAMAAILTAKDIPISAVTPLAVTAAALGSLAGGFIGARIAGENGWAVGAGVGGLLFLAVLLLGGMRMLQAAPGTFALIKLAAMLLSAICGGILGVGKRRKKHRK